MCHCLSTYGPSCTEFVYPGCWHFDNGATSKFEDVLPRVLTLPVHLKFVWLDKQSGPFKEILTPVPFGFKSYWYFLGCGWAYGVLGLRLWGQGLTIEVDPEVDNCIFTEAQELDRGLQAAPEVLFKSKSHSR